jgi:hypothetical protein
MSDFLSEKRFSRCGSLFAKPKVDLRVRHGVDRYPFCEKF